jgi:hypothetical protein
MNRAITYAFAWILCAVSVAAGQSSADSVAPAPEVPAQALAPAAIATPAPVPVYVVPGPVGGGAPPATVTLEPRTAFAAVAPLAPTAPSGPTGVPASTITIAHHPTHRVTAFVHTHPTGQFVWPWQRAKPQPAPPMVGAPPPLPSPQSPPKFFPAWSTSR